LSLKRVTFADGGQRAELDENYALAHYRFTRKNRLELTLLSEKLFKEAVKSGELAGTLSPDGEDVALTCTSDQLAEFLRRHKPEEFLGELMPMEKISRLPEAPAQ